ncbi:MAG: DNA polymerase II large subunit [Nanoarchaeota archaeon]
METSVSFKIAEEIAQQKYCKFENQLEAMDAGIRVGFAYTTLGVVSSPLEGFTDIKTGKTLRGETYIKAYFSGPIRSAGATASCVVIMLTDYIRQIFGYARYDPTEEEAKRTVTELYDYHERVTNLQYLPTEEEVYFIGKNIPIQVCGDPTEKREVSNYKNLSRIETDFIRGGFCIILGEGLAQKAKKAQRILKGIQKNGFIVKDWEWLDKYVELHEKRDTGKTDASPTYIKDLVAGRPVFGYPGKGFRFRYGRSRVAGFSATSVHPATMGITNDFIATGTQLKIEKPTKGCVVTPCDLIDGPVVKLKNGSVKKINNYEEAKKLYKDVEEIIYIGDMLFPLGDVINRNAVLIKPGYVEEWWNLELEKAGGRVSDCYDVSVEEAIELSEKFNIPFYPKYIYFWTEISYEQFLGFIDWLNHSRINNGKMLFPYNPGEKERFQVGKRAMELTGIPHEVSIENVILDIENTKALLVNLGFDVNYQGEIDINNKLKEIVNEEGNKVLDIVNKLSKFRIKDKTGEFIGSRMGRPEKAKLRKLTGSPNVLFPVGEEGGRLRSVNAAEEIGKVRGDFPFNYCEKCKRETIYRTCECCGEKVIEKKWCRRCEREIEGDKCLLHDTGDRFKNTRIDLKHYLEKAKEKLGYFRTDIPVLIKGVRGTSSQEHAMENLVKGILRAKYNLSVNKDGTIRYDMTELPISHFKPKEIEVSVKKLKELGYNHDWNGNDLVNEEQILELKPHDIIIPCNIKCGDEKADDVFMNVSKFIDELLVKFYKIPEFYNIKKREDLVGQLGVCMAPHNCAGVICRIIGFSKVQGLLASPYMHAAMRRDCLGHDNYISVNENGNWKIRKIGDFVEEKNPEKNIDFFGTLGMKVNNIYTWSNPGQKQVLELTKHQPSKMIKIFLEDGREIETTKNHIFYTKGKIQKPAAELNVGDKLMVSYKKNIEEKDIDEIFLPGIFENKDYVMLRNVRDFLNKFENMGKHDNFGFRDSFPIKKVKEILERNGKTLKDLPNETRICIKRDNVSLPIRIKFDENLLSLIGLYIAEGYMRGNSSKKGFYQVYFSAQDKEVREFISDNMVKYFGLVSTEKKLDRLTYSSRILFELFKYFFGLSDSAKTKRIPSFLLNLKKEKIAALLRGYYEGDGSVSLSDIRVVCDSVSEGLKHDLSFVLSRFGIFTKFYEYEKEPGPKVREFYIRKNREIPKFKITKIIIPSNFVKKFKKIGFLSNRKNDILNKICEGNPYGMKIDFDEDYVYPKIVGIEETEEKLSYCFNVPEEHNFFSNDILVHNCDGDEAAVMLLMDVLINFSKKFLPSHRGGTQDAPLVLNGRINAREVDDQILDFELVKSYPLGLYEKAEEKRHSSEIKIEMVKQRIGRGEDPYINTGFTHDSDNFNSGATCSSYKTLPTMQEKVEAQMDLCVKLRSVDQGDVARLIIDRHFMRDLKGNLRKFSQQNFRCGKCNEIFRRPPLNGKCTHCGNPKLIFTISYGSIVKYLEPALDLVKNFNVPAYIKQDLELTKKYIESIFGKDTEKQQNIGQWF